MPEGRGEKPQFVQKTPEQIQNQIKWSKIHARDQWRQFDVRDELKHADQKTINSAIDAERASLPQDVPDWYIDMNTPLAGSYRNYLTALRSLYRQESVRTHDAIKNRPDGQTATEAQLNHMRYPQETAIQMIDDLQGRYGKLSRTYTDEQIQSAIETEEGFKAMVENIIEKPGDDFEDNIHQLMEVLPNDKLQTIFDRIVVKHPESISWLLPRIQPHTTPERQRSLFVSASNNAKYKQGLYDALVRHNAIDLLKDEEKEAFVKNLVSEIPAKELSAGTTAFLIEKGLLKPDDVHDHIIKALDENPDTALHLEWFYDYLTPDEQKRVHDLCVEGLTRKEEPFYIHYVDSLDKILGQEEKLLIVRQRADQEPNLISRNYRIAKEYLPQDEIVTWIKAKLDARSDDLFWGSFLREVMRDEDIGLELKQAFARFAIEVKPEESLMNIDEISAVYDGNIRDLIKSLALRSSSYSGYSDIDKWSKYFDGDPQSQRQIILELISRDRTFAFTGAYQDKRQEAFRQLFTKEEVQRLIYKQAELGVGRMFGHLREIRDVLGSDREFKNFLNQNMTNDPEGVLQHFDQLVYLYSPQEVMQTIDKALLDIKSTTAAISTIEIWGKYVDPNYAAALVMRYAVFHPEETYDHLLPCLRYLPEDLREPFLKELVSINPPLALINIHYIRRKASEEEADLNLDKFFETNGPSSLFIKAVLDKQRISYAPRTLTEFYKDYPRTTDSQTRVAMWKNARDIYTYITGIEKHGLEGKLREIRDSENTPKNREVNLLASMYCLAIFKEKSPDTFLKLETLGNTTAEVEKTLVELLAKKMEVSGSVSEEQVRRFMAAMESPAPFVIYYLQQDSSPERSQLMKEMFTSLLDGNYRSWKFGKDDENTFNNLKEAGLLPKNLTEEQYALWKQDETSTSFEALTASAEVVVADIRKIIKENAEYLSIDISLESPPSELRSEIQAQLAKTGQTLGRINAEMSQLRKDPETNQSRLVSLEAQKFKVEQDRKKFTKTRDILRLMELLPEEVASGYLLDPNDKTKKIALISDNLGQLKASTSPDGQFIYDRIVTFIDNFHNQSAEKQNLSCTDSANPKVSIEIGDNPVSSCQHYAHGAHNNCLLAYSSDPNSKILIIRNDNKSLVARSIFRLLEASDGQPSLHIERIYSSHSGPAVQKLIYAHALRKANEMGVKLHVSTDAQNAQGVETGVYVPDSFETSQVPYSLNSNGSRSPLVYVDSAGGVRSFGKYSIDKLREITTS